MAVSDVANLVLSGAALGISGVALMISRKQVVLDERSLRLAEREHDLAEQERAARSALVVDIEWQPDGGVSRYESINSPFTAVIRIRNDGARDATDVVVTWLVPVGVHAASLQEGQVVPQTERRQVDGASVLFRRYERVIERVRKVPQETVATVDIWREGHRRGTEPITLPVVVEVRCADQPEGHEVQTWEKMLQWIVPPEPT